MSTYKLGSNITFDFTTHNPATGNVSDADVLPTCEIFQDITDTSLIVLTVVKRTAKTGDYRVTIPATAANGFAVGNSYNVIATAIVNGVTAKARIGVFILDSVSGQDLAATLGTPVALDSGAATLAGMLTKMADNNGGADFNAGSDSLHSLEGVVTPMKIEVDNMNFVLLPDIKDTVDTIDADLPGIQSVLNEVLDYLENKLVINVATSEWWLYDAAGTTVVKKWPLKDKNGGNITVAVGAVSERGKRIL